RSQLCPWLIAGFYWATRPATRKLTSLSHSRSRGREECGLRAVSSTDKEVILGRNVSPLDPVPSIGSAGKLLSVYCSHVVLRQVLPRKPAWRVIPIVPTETIFESGRVRIAGAQCFGIQSGLGREIDLDGRVAVLSMRPRVDGVGAGQGIH